MTRLPNPFALFIAIAVAIVSAVAVAVVSAAHAAPPGEYQCLIEPYQRIEVRSPVEALIESVLVERGSLVKKGQPLVRLDAGVEQAALASARHRATMEGQVKSAEARLAYARDKHRRRSELHQQNFLSAQERDDAHAEMRVAEAELIEARDTRELAALEAQRIEQLLRQRTLLSPFNGVVLEVTQHPGELAQSGEGARAILKLAQIHPLRVEVVLPVSLYGAVRPGMRARVTAEVGGGGPHGATVKIVDRVVDSASGTYGARLDLPNPGGRIPAGVKCRVRFE